MKYNGRTLLFAGFKIASVYSQYMRRKNVERAFLPKQVFVRQQNCFYPQRNSQLHIADTNTQTVSSLLTH